MRRVIPPRAREMTRGNYESPRDLPHVTCHVSPSTCATWTLSVIKELLNAINYILIVGSISKYDIVGSIVSLVVSVQEIKFVIPFE